MIIQKLNEDTPKMLMDAVPFAGFSVHGGVSVIHIDRFP
jgi:hypothetical protein